MKLDGGVSLLGGDCGCGCGCGDALPAKGFVAAALLGFGGATVLVAVISAAFATGFAEERDFAGVVAATLGAGKAAAETRGVSEREDGARADGARELGAWLLGVFCFMAVNP